MKSKFPFLLMAALILPSVTWAQGGRDAGADARTDALLGTPNKATPVPQTNIFSTSPGLEQQAPGPHGKPRSPPAPTPPPTGDRR